MAHLGTWIKFQAKKRERELVALNGLVFTARLSVKIFYWYNWSLDGYFSLMPKLEETA